MTSPIEENASKVEASSTASSGGSFLKETLNELKLVVWPTRQKLFSESIAVIFMVSLSAATIAIVSRFFGWASSLIFK